MPADAAPPLGRPDVMRVALGGGPAVAAAVVGAAAALGRGPLVAAVVVVQVVMAVAWLAVIGMPAAAGGVAIVVAAAIAADVYVARDDALTAVAGVVAASFVVALLMQLARRERRRVTTSLAGVMSGAVLAVLTAYLLAIQAGAGGRPAAALVGFAVASALLAGRLLDAAFGRPRLRRLPTRGWAGLLAGIAAAAGVGAYAGSRHDELTTGAGVVLAVSSALAAVAADIGAAVGSAELTDGRRLLAVRLLAAALPLAAAAPVGYAVTTIALA